MSETSEGALRGAELDHVHVFVPERDRAAAWYRDVLGLAVVLEHAHWAADGGPLTVSGDGGTSGVALFEGEAPSGGERRRVVALRVAGEDLLDFLAGLERHGLVDRHGAAVRASDVVDHGESFSIYFVDPWGNPFEVTSYDAELVRSRLGAR
ncbi:MAG: VOC family protein [Deltaproteobacteria bacterium]|nr:VOC family protein [Deltaproteobacteria bacterium]